MILYHGTSASGLAAILRDGLQPRANTLRSNWKDFPSDDQMVYLTSTYALHFALAASNDEARAAVIEIDVRVAKDRLYPDEDFIARQIRLAKKCGLEEAQEIALTNRECFKRHWKDSLDGAGVVAVKGPIPASAVARSVTFSMKGRWLLNVDPCLSEIAFRIVGEKYRAMTRWAFGDEPELPAVKDARQFAQCMDKEQGEQAIAAALACSKDRAGIEVKSYRTESDKKALNKYFGGGR